MIDKQAHIRGIEFCDIRPLLPVIAEWDKKITRPIDIFITSLGFEDRSVAISKAIALEMAGSAHHKNALGIICCYSTNVQDNERNRELLKTALASFCKRQVDTDADSPQEVEKFIGDQILSVSESKKAVEVAFDISASSGNLILSVLHALIKYRDSISLRILYSEPARYFPLQEDYDTNPENLVLRACDSGDADSYQEYGVCDVDSNELYPGIDGENRPEYIIAVPSLRTSRLVRCLSHLSDQPLSSPDKYIYWILSEPPSNELKWRQDLQRKMVSNTLSSLVGFAASDPLAPQLNSENNATCSTLDYRDILHQVIQEADRRIGNNISLVHMGSKLQALGIAFALSARNEISVCYAKPVEYNPTRYTEGIGPMWQLDVPNLAEVIGNIHLIGTLTFTAKIETERTGLPTM